MKPNRPTSTTWPLHKLLLIVPLLILPACAVKPQVPHSLPTLPKRPSVNMPPMPSAILTGVQDDLAELEKRRQVRVQRLMPSTPLGQSTKSSKAN